MKRIHIDLFSGIGGASLAADTVWGRENLEHIFCDNEPFAQQVLRKHWPKAKIYGDIRAFTNTSWQRQQKVKRGLTFITDKDDNRTYLLTGGFPCQPFSQAGRRKGTEDDRHLWPEMLRVIREFRPTWVIGENVAGFVTWSGGLVLRQVLSDLEGEGYEIQAFVIPAVAVNAPHRRDRVWIVAHSASGRERIGQPERSGRRKSKKAIRDRDSDAPNARPERQKKQQQQTKGNEQYSWNRNWLEVATEFCSVDDGLPVALDGFKLSKSQHRAAQLKGYGNAWVPQVAIEIMRAIKQIDEA